MYGNLGYKPLKLCGVCYLLCQRLALGLSRVAAKQSTARPVDKCLTAHQICTIECACFAAGCTNPVGLQAALEAIDYAESVEFTQLRFPANACRCLKLQTYRHLLEIKCMVKAFIP